MRELRINRLLAASGAVYMVCGVGLLFAPQEIAEAAGGEPGRALTALLQVLGSALFGFAMLNWANRYARTEGVLGRPLVLANFAHAGSAALLTAKAAALPPRSTPLVVAAVVYGLLAIGFGARLFGRPSPAGE
jgi:hypothetical protein